MRIKISGFFLLLISMISCLERKAEDKVVEATPDIIIKEVLASSQNCPPDSSSCTYVYIVYPVFSDTSKSQLNFMLDSKLKTIAADFVSEEAARGTFEHIAQSFIRDFETFTLDYPEYNFGWYMKLNTEITYESASTISFRIDAESFTGGAHPNSSTSFFVVDVPTNHVLNIGEIIADTARFKNLLEDAFRKKKGMEENQSYADIGYYIDDNEFLLNDNIGLSEDGVIVHFNPYEIAPYSEGATTIEIKKEALGNLLKVE